MIDIRVSNIYKINRLQKGNVNKRNRVFNGKIVAIRKARIRVNSKKSRSKDVPYTKAFIILVEYEGKIDDLLNKKVEIKVI